MESTLTETQGLRARAFAALESQVAATAAREEAERREEDQEMGERLKRLLSERLGIDADPTTNRYEVDGITLAAIVGRTASHLLIVHPCPDCGQDLFGSYSISGEASVAQALKIIEQNPKDSYADHSHFCKKPAPSATNYIGRAVGLAIDAYTIEGRNGAGDSTTFVLQNATLNALLAIAEALKGIEASLDYANQLRGGF